MDVLERRHFVQYTYIDRPYSEAKNVMGKDIETCPLLKGVLNLKSPKHTFALFCFSLGAFPPSLSTTSPVWLYKRSTRVSFSTGESGEGGVACERSEGIAEEGGSTVSDEPVGGGGGGMSVVCEAEVGRASRSAAVEERGEFLSGGSDWRGVPD